MSGTESLQAWVVIPVALLLFIGGSISLIGAFGLLRLPNFYQRIHAPAITVTLGAGCLLLASMLYFSLSASRLVVHELLISAFILMSAPVVSMLLLRAAVYRDLRAKKPDIAAIREMLPSDSTKK
jgi:multicomponent K+:H+ antiporter subunit G